MNWDEDIDLLAGRKSLPKQGRRTNNTTPNTESNNSDSFFEVNPFDTSIESMDKPSKMKKTGVWVDDTTKSARGSKNTTNIIELERFQNESKIQDESYEIPVIPDIEDLQEDPLNLPDVKPVVTVEKSTYKELDNQLGTIPNDKINFGNLGNIDLSFLLNKLYPEKEVQSRPEVWTMESLFNDLSRNITVKKKN